MAALGQFLAVPNQKLLSWLKRLDGIKVDLQTILAGNEVLLLDGTGGVDVAHPVASLLVQAVEDVVQAPLHEDLTDSGGKQGGRRMRRKAKRFFAAEAWIVRVQT